MIATGIAHPPLRLHERSNLPSTELVYLAMKAMRLYKTTRLITSLAWGWEQALASAALELEIPYTVAIPYPGREVDWPKQMRVNYFELLARASEVYRICDQFSDTAVMEGHIWRVERADLVLALWEYDFKGETFRTIHYSLGRKKQVVNLWRDWESLYELRKPSIPFMFSKKRSGAQVYDKK